MPKPVSPCCIWPSETACSPGWNLRAGKSTQPRRKPPESHRRGRVRGPPVCQFLSHSAIFQRLIVFGAGEGVLDDELGHAADDGVAAHVDVPALGRPGLAERRDAVGRGDVVEGRAVELQVVVGRGVHAAVDQVVCDVAGQPVGAAGRLGLDSLHHVVAEVGHRLLELVGAEAEVEGAPQLLVGHAEGVVPLAGLAGDGDVGLAVEVEGLLHVGGRADEGGVFLLRDDVQALV